MAFKALLIILLAALAPYFLERGQSLYHVFYNNAPSRLISVDTFASHEIKFADRIRSCEDALLIESEGFAILGCDPGRERYNTVMGIFLPGPVDTGKLYVYNYKDADLSDNEALKELTFVNFDYESEFHTLGMAYNETTSTLLVSSHRPSHAAIEVFKIDREALTATHIRSIQHPLIHGPNSIVLVNDHEFYVTNDHHFLVRDFPIANKVETYLGLPGGTIVHVDMSAADSVQATIVARMSFANGIELLNATTAAVASSTWARVDLFDISKPENATVPVFKRISKIRVPFAADNLSVSKDGALIIAGHPHFPALVKFTKSRHICNGAEELDEQTRETCKTITAPSWVARWTEKEGLQTLYAGLEYPSSATGARDSERGVGIIAGLYAKGIFVWRE